MSKKKEVRVSEEELEMENNNKKKYANSYEKKKAAFKVAGWFMAIVMLVGSLLAIFGLLAYLR